MMEYVRIVKLLLQIDDMLFEEMKSILLEKYISFSIMDDEKITKEMLCEKLCDYIEKVLSISNKSFEKLVNDYMDNIGDLVKEHLSKVCTAKDAKGKERYEDSRAIKYFKQVQRKREDKENLLISFEDYSRIVICLYAEIIRNKYQSITDFDFSFEHIECHTIINAIETEGIKEKHVLNLKLSNARKKFKGDKYSKNSFVLIMVIIMIYYLKNKAVKGDY